MFNFKHQAPVPPTPPGIVDLTGKTILITGSNQGIGLECARQLLILKASTIILAVRTPSKGEAARQLLLADPTIASLRTRPEIKVMQLDMASYESVVHFSNRVKTEFKKLDAALLNAGVGQLNFEKAETGHEKGLQVNHLSNALLAVELLPLLKSTAVQTGAPSRLTWVGSRTHERSSFAGKAPFLSGSSVLERMDDKKQYSGASTYGNTKLLVAMFVKQLAQKISSDEVVINNVCPGSVNTGMSDVLPTPLRQMVNVYKAIYARTVETGGWIVVNALEVAGKETHGKFLKDRNVIEPIPFILSANGQEMQHKLWDETLVEVTKADPSVAAVVKLLR